MNQLSLPLAIQAPPFGPFPWEASCESHLQAPLHKPLFDAHHRAATDGEDRSLLPIGCLWFTLALITQ